MECAGRGLSFWSYQMVQDLCVTLNLVDLEVVRLGLMLTNTAAQNLGKPPLPSSDNTIQ